MAGYRLCIFDLDGTLLDTLEDLKDGVNAALSHFGFPERSLDEVRRFVGNGIRNLMIRAVPGGEEEPRFEDIFLWFKDYYTRHCMEKTREYEGISELFTALSEKDIAIAVLSNKNDEAVKELIAHYFPGRVRYALGHRKNSRIKPAPDAVFAIMEALDISPAETVYIGDSDVDIKTAENAGVDCISVDWGFRDRDFLIENGAKKIVSSCDELLSAIVNTGREAD
jgi:phosphoglycolate phosphatase